MLTELLEQTEQAFPSEQLRPDPAAWRGLTERFCDQLSVLVDKALSAAALAMPARVFKESVQEYLVVRDPTVVVGEFRLRPKTSYYTKMGRRPPSPEDPQGGQDTGVEVSISLCRGYPNGKLIRRPFVSVDFGISGHRERERFRELLKDQRYIVERLVLATQGALFTPCVFDNVDRAPRRSSAFDKLALYYENEVDVEGTFSIQRELDQSSTEGDLLQALVPMLALYDAAMGYCIPRVQRDRVLDHIGILR